MTKQELLDKQAHITQQFDQLRAQTDEQQQAIESNEDELKRLQGEYRAVTALITELEASEGQEVVTPKKAVKRG